MVCKWISHPSVMIVVAAVVLGIVFVATDRVWSQDSPESIDRGRIEGVVTDAETGAPVPGVKLIYRLDLERPESFGASSIEAFTQADGRYVLSVPFGDYQKFDVLPPDGYLRDEEQVLEAMFNRDGNLTTRMEPVRKVNWSVKRGVAWRFSSDGFPVHSTLIVSDIKGEEETGKSSQLVRIDAHGKGTFTLPNSACTVHFLSPVLQNSHVMLEVESGFLPAAAVEVKSEPQVTVIRDRNGRRARLTHATAVIDEQGVRIQFSTHNLKKYEVTGLVRDANGVLVEGAVVRVWFHSWKGSGGLLPFWARSGKGGIFRIPNVSADRGNFLIQCEGSAPGYAPAMSKSVSVNAETLSQIDLGTIELHPGRIVPIKVVDPLGRDVEGAKVRIDGSDRQFRTDRKGRCELYFLTLDECKVLVHYGRQSTSAVLSSSSIAGRQPEILLTLGDIYTQKFGTKPKVTLEPLATGTPAPEFKIQQWTDGESRNLKDFSGKVIVLIFWNQKAPHCPEELTIVNNLKKTFEGRGVEFLGIHPPTGDVQTIRDFMVKQDWDIPTGIDKGTDKQTDTGQTVVAYGIEDSSFVVIGKDGRISLNWDTLVDDEATEAVYKEATAALGIPVDDEGHPLDDSEEGCESCTRIIEYVRAKAIEAALGL